MDSADRDGAFARANDSGMRIYEFTMTQWVSKPPEKVFSFFSDARNLELLTPPWINFRILTPMPIAMGKGTRLHYEIRLHGIPIDWETLITEWEPPRFFADEQMKGPYRLWRYEHRFDARDGGTECGDRVAYTPRGGALANYMFVERDVRRIFEYRRKMLDEMFASHGN